MAITVGNTSCGGDQTLSWAHTVDGSSNILIVAFTTRDSSESDSDVLTVKYNNVDLTEAQQYYSSLNQYGITIWYLVDPPTGTSYTIAVTLNGVVSDYGGYAVDLAGVDTADPVDNYWTSQSGTNTTTWTGTVNPAATGTIAIGATGCGTNYADRLSVTTGTQIDEIDLGSYCSSCAYAMEGSDVAVITWTCTDSEDWGGLLVTFNPGSSTPTLVISECAHSHTADNLTLTQLHILAIADAIHTHSADNVDLVQIFTLSIDEAVHGHTADNLDLIQIYTLAIADAVHEHIADNLDLTQLHILAIDEATHSHIADNLDLTQLHILAIDEAFHEHTADGLILETGEVVDLVIEDAIHSHIADNVDLTQLHYLVIAEAAHGHTADNVDLTQSHNILIDDAIHGHIADHLDLTQLHIIVIQDCWHAHYADGIILDTGEEGEKKQQPLYIWYLPTRMR